VKADLKINELIVALSFYESMMRIYEFEILTNIGERYEIH
tara:strand:- start:310 stop:429 length:120 start_codon:yes stop_codon:yes gene_type:complete